MYSDRFRHRRGCRKPVPEAQDCGEMFPTHVHIGGHVPKFQRECENERQFKLHKRRRRCGDGNDQRVATSHMER